MDGVVELADEVVVARRTGVVSVADEGEAITKRHMERAQLARAWDTQQRTTADDWRDWMRTLSLTLLKESPSVALHYCSVLAERSQPLRLELFDAAFASCWDELGHLEEQEKRAMELRCRRDRSTQEQELEAATMRHKLEVLELQREQERKQSDENHAAQLRYEREKLQVELKSERARHEAELLREQEFDTVRAARLACTCSPS